MQRYWIQVPETDSHWRWHSKGKGPTLIRKTDHGQSDLRNNTDLGNCTEVCFKAGTEESYGNTLMWDLIYKIVSVIAYIFYNTATCA